MKNSSDNLAEVMPSAVPSEEDIRRWEMLSRQEQLRQLRAALTHPDCSTVTDDTMAEVLAAARRRIASARG